MHDLFLQTVAPCLKVARFANCERVNGGIQSLVERSNKLVELDISGCENIPYLICANLLGSFWPCFVTLRAARCGDMRVRREVEEKKLILKKKGNCAFESPFCVQMHFLLCKVRAPHCRVTQWSKVS